MAKAETRGSVEQSEEARNRPTRIPRATGPRQSVKGIRRRKESHSRMFPMEPVPPTCQSSPERSDSALTPYTKVSSKGATDVNTTCQAAKLLGENIGGNLHDLAPGDDFENTTQVVQSVKGKTDHLDSVKMQNFCSVKDLIRE